MAARRGFHVDGDNTPVMRLPLRSLQNELLGQQLTMSASKPVSSKSPFKKKGETFQREELVRCSPVRSTFTAMASLTETEFAKENAAAVASEEEEAAFRQGCPDPRVGDVIDGELEPQSGTSSGMALKLSEHAEDSTDSVLIGRAGDWAGTVGTQDQWASVGCLSDSSTSRLTQTASEDSAVEHSADGQMSDVTFRPLHCSGVELEIANASYLPVETTLRLTECAADVSGYCSFQNDHSDHLGFSQHSDQNRSNAHEDHAYCGVGPDDSCSRDELLPGGTSLMETAELTGPLDGWDRSGQAPLWGSTYLENVQESDLSHILHGNSAWSCSAGEHDAGLRSLTPDQPEDQTEKSVSDDQSQGPVTPDQSQDQTEKSVIGDQSQGTVPADQSQGNADESVTTDKSPVQAEKGATGDQSLGAVTVDQSRDQMEKSDSDQSQVTVNADQSPDNAVKSITADKSQGSTVKCPAADQSQDQAENCVTVGQSHDTVEKGLPAECGGHEPCTVVLTGVSDVTTQHAQERCAEGPSCMDTGRPALARTSHLREPGRGCPWDTAASPVGPRASRLWMGNLESPMPLPQLNSTLIQSILTSATATPKSPAAEGGTGPQLGPLRTPGALTGTQTGPLLESLGPLRAPGDLSDIQTGPLLESLGLLSGPGGLTDAQLGPVQDKLGPQTPVHLTGSQTRPLQLKLRQMGELLLRASQNLVPAVPLHSASTWTSPVQVAEQAVNTSGLFERKRQFSVAEASTSTDTLPWNLDPDSMAGWSREDLEQRLRSTLVVAEVLSQQLTSARTHRGHAPPPSDLRDRLVQTEHTELSQSLWVVEELRSLHAGRVAELERTVGSHLELIPALSQARQEQVSLNAEYTESLQAADELLKDVIGDQARISEELRKARYLLRRAGPVLQKLHQRAAAALQAWNQQERDTSRMQDELEQTASSLQDAREQIGDLNLQVTILTSEMAVLRQRLSEVEEEREQVEMKSTELSATLSSTQASCTVLQQALSTQTHRLEEVQEESYRRVEELGVALAERDARLAQAYQRLQELQSQLASACETNEFLQMESEVSREQVVQSEALVKSHLQGLRERNLECEDLKQELWALRLQRDALQEEVLSTQETARTLLLDMGKKLALTSTDITLLHHKVYTLNSALNTSLNTQSDRSCQKRAPPTPAAPPRHSARSFVDSVMAAITTEEPGTSETGEDGCPSAALGSGNSAFTRVPTATPKEDAEDESNVLELLAGLGDAVSQLVCTADRVRELRDRQCEEMQHAVSNLQEELDSQTAGYRSQVADLNVQVAHLQAQVKKDAMEEKTMLKLCSDLDESRKLCQQQKSENKELRREMSSVQCSLHQAQVEAEFLKKELSGGGDAKNLPELGEKVRLQMEVDRLRKSLTEAGDSRSKLLERAKRHQLVLEGNQRNLEKEVRMLDQTIQTVKQTLLSIPEVVKDCEQLEKLVAYLG